jgi:hypothetical protein
MIGRQREKELARDLGGRRQPASGAFWNQPGDVITEWFLVESKYTSALSFSITLDHLTKIRAEAGLKNRSPVMVIELGTANPPEKWVVMPYEEWKALLGG